MVVMGETSDKYRCLGLKMNQQTANLPHQSGFSAQNFLRFR
jgi:hypothetical protein